MLPFKNIERESVQEDSPIRNCRTSQFRALFQGLPESVKELAQAAFRRFVENPNHPALRLHRLQNNSKGSHRTGSWSVSITKQYRAIYVVDGDTNVWYWVGSHNDYENFTGKK